MSPLLFLAALLFSVAWGDTLQYLVDDQATLEKVKDYPGATFFLLNDIVVDNCKTLSTASNPFRGTFHGRGHTITCKSMVITEEVGDSIGLFGRMDGAKVDDLRLVATYSGLASDSSSTRYYGALAGQITNSLISDVYVSVSGSLTVGGVALFGALAGMVQNSAITNSVVKNGISFSGVNSGADNAVLFGGLAGVAGNSTISHVTGRTTATATSGAGLAAGGIVGTTERNTHITNYNFTGSIGCSSSGTMRCGGVVGLAGGSTSQTIMNGTSDFDLHPSGQGEFNVGGLFGRLDSTNSGALTIKNLEVTVRLTDFRSSGTAHIGGIAGYAGYVDASYVGVSGTIDGDIGAHARVGGAFGQLASGNVRQCISRTTVVVQQLGGSSMSVGGFVGLLSGGDKLSQCGAYGSVTCIRANSVSVEFSGCGGFVGTNYISITQCFAAGSVQASGSLGDLGVGGFLGHGVEKSLDNCASYGNVKVTSSTTGPQYLVVGGFAGWCRNSGGWGEAVSLTEILHLGDVDVTASCSLKVGNFLGALEKIGYVDRVASIGNTKVYSTESSDVIIGGFAGHIQRPRTNGYEVRSTYQRGKLDLDTEHPKYLGGHTGYCMNPLEDSMVFVDITTPQAAGNRGYFVGYFDGYAGNIVGLRKNIAVVSVNSPGANWGAVGNSPSWLYANGGDNVANKDMNGVAADSWKTVGKTTEEMKAGLGNYPGYDSARVFHSSEYNDGYPSFYALPTPLTNNHEKLGSNGAGTYFNPEKWVLNTNNNQGKPYPIVEYAYSSVLNKHDRYTAPLDHECRLGWSGDNCNTFACRNNAECNGATCSNGVCQCPPDKTGKDCFLDVCGTCSGGTCAEITSEAHICSCPANSYFFNGECLRADACNGGCGYGKCVVKDLGNGETTGQCVCDAGMETGDGFCDTENCWLHNNCRGGSCDPVTKKCTCASSSDVFDPYDELKCLTKCPGLPNGHGVCLDMDGNYECSSPWVDDPKATGNCTFYDCSQDTSATACDGKGPSACVATDLSYPSGYICTCDKDSFLGSDGSCTHGCDGDIEHGHCVATDQIQCDAGWYSPYSADKVYCTEYSCRTHLELEPDAEVCNGLGTCSGSGCECPTGTVFLNGTCHYICSLEPEGEPCIETQCMTGDEVCSGRGSCGQDESGAFVCTCDTRFGGERCEECAEGYVDVEGHGCVIQQCERCLGGVCIEVLEDEDLYLRCSCELPEEPVTFLRSRRAPARRESGIYRYDEKYGGCVYDLCAEKTCAENDGYCDIIGTEKAIRECVCPSGTEYHEGYCVVPQFSLCYNGKPSLAANSTQWVCACPEGEELRDGYCYTEVCVPGACKNGHCTVGPLTEESHVDYCACDPDATLEDGKCVVGTCEVETCANGECVIDEEHRRVCECPEGFQLEDTECIRHDCQEGKCGLGTCALHEYVWACDCEEGQARDETGFCYTDKCDSCVNGECVLGADFVLRCQCDEASGYELDNGVCIKHECHEGECGLGTCTLGDYVWSCDCGEELENRPDGKCYKNNCGACENGKCNTVDYVTECVCDFGYLMHEGVCTRVPECLDCGKGHCAAEGSEYYCECEEGSDHALHSGPTCVFNDVECAHGTRVVDKTTFEVTCTCNEADGFQLVDGSCVKDDCKGCEKGRCVLDETTGVKSCKCDGDRTLQLIGTTNTCVLNSCGACKNGNCLPATAENDYERTCACQDGFELEDAACVKRTCQEGECGLGACALDNYVWSCKCEEGQTKEEGICVLNSCGACDHGTCQEATAENGYERTCACDPGYAMHGGVCVFVKCTAEGCKGGECGVSSGELVCTCEEGFSYVPELNACYSVAFETCPGGTLKNETQPSGAVAQACDCGAGAKYNATAGVCVVGAQKDCKNGGYNVVSDELLEGKYYYVCECPRGMLIASDYLTCLFDKCDEEKCSPHGACAQEGKEVVCKCNPGYQLEDGACRVQDCKCIGGVCEVKGEESVCKCPGDYPTFDEKTGICYRGVAGECENGEIKIGEDRVAVCLCEEGMKLYEDGNCYEDKCVGKGASGCGSGSCEMDVSKEAFVCTCPDGFLAEDLDCYDLTECEAACDGTCRVENREMVCVCPWTFEGARLIATAADGFRCRTECTNCRFGECTEAEAGEDLHCECDEGRKLIKGQGGCVDVTLQTACEHGNAVLNEEELAYECHCDKLPDSEFDAELKDCVPEECGTCLRGRCVYGIDGPVCSCPEGTALSKDGYCVAPDYCLNGEVQELEVDGHLSLKCLCNSGYRLDGVSEKCFPDECGNCVQGECGLSGDHFQCVCSSDADVFLEGTRCIKNACGLDNKCPAGATCKLDDETMVQSCICADSGLPAGEEGCYAGNCAWCATSEGATCSTDEEHLIHSCVCPEGYTLDATDRSNQVCVLAPKLKSSGLSGGAIAGIIIAVLLIAAGISVGVYFLLRKKRAASQSQLRVPAPVLSAGYEERDVVV